MPKSRGRRRKPNRGRAGGGRSVAERKARALTDLPILQATDEAEARGDAMAALRIIERDQQRRGDEDFWRPARLERLVQLAGLVSLPRWATSRWILAQAAQCLDSRLRPRVLKAMDIAVAARGGEAALAGRDELDARAKVLDHDWLFRQVLLYELGGLQHFIGRVASPDLLAGADRIHDWARTPMGGFRFRRESPLTLAWSDLATGQEVETVNLGAAAWLDPGECAIGRLVPIEGGAMFESAPLVVPADVARQVADDPPDWVAALKAACLEPGPGDDLIATGTGHDFRLLTDVPRVVQQLIMLTVAENSTGRPASIETLADLMAYEAGLVRVALDERLTDVELPWNPWPSVAATLSDPRAVIGLRDILRGNDVPKLERLAKLLAGPAGDICLALVHDLESAA